MLDVSPLRSRLCAIMVVSVLAPGFFASAQTSNPPAHPADYSAFKIISERNIFNPNRYARNSTARPRPTTRTVRRNSFSLAGTMSYDEGESAGRYAFFDGSSADYRKALKQDDAIAGFKVAAITADSVTLLLDTNQTILKIGMQMRDDGEGQWSLSTETASYAGNSSVSDSARGYQRGSGFSGQRNAAAGAPNTNNTETVPEPDFSGIPGGFPPPPDMMEPPAETTPFETLPTGPGSDALRRLMELRAQEEQQSGSRN